MLRKNWRLVGVKNRLKIVLIFYATPFLKIPIIQDFNSASKIIYREHFVVKEINIFHQNFH